MHTSRTVATLLAAMVPGLLACGEGLPQCEAVSQAPVSYVLAEFSLDAQYNTAPPKVEVNETPTYTARRNSLKTAAIRMPDNCLHDVAGKATGLAANAQTILSTDCGVYLKEIETALAKSGFRVFSWDALHQLEHTKGIPTYAAAKELGADVVFIFNSLDVASINSGAESGSKIRYFQSNAQGRPLEPLVTKEDDTSRAFFHDFVRAHTNAPSAADAPPTALSCVLDATAVIVNLDTSSGALEKQAGESIWFFRRAVTFPLRLSSEKRFLFASAGGAWAPVKPEGLPTEPGKQNYSSEDVEHTSRAASTQDPYQAEKLALMQAAAKEFVERFRGNQGGAR